MRALVASGWSALVHRTDVVAILTGLQHYRDLDNDAVAAAFYALSSVQCDAGAAWWAASRALDQAFSCVDSPADAAAFRPIEEDATSAVVQSELSRQFRLFAVAESAPVLAGAVDLLRFPSDA